LSGFERILKAFAGQEKPDKTRQNAHGKRVGLPDEVLFWHRLPAFNSMPWATIGGAAHALAR
jgi:hypothetical protein